MRGDLAAVRGHLRRDRRCLDRLFEAPGTGGHWAALHRAAALRPPGGRRLSPGEGRGRGPPWTAAARELRAAGEPPQRDASDAGGAEVRLRCMLQHSSASVESAKLLLAAKASVDVKNDQRLGASADVTTVFKTVFHRQPQ